MKRHRAVGISFDHMRMGDRMAVRPMARSIIDSAVLSSTTRRAVSLVA